MVTIQDEIIDIPFGSYPPNYKGEYAPFCDILKTNLKNWSEDFYKNKYPYTSYKNYYDINSQGYREKSWKDIDWNNIILCLGCSFMDGMGVSKEHSIPGILTKLTGIYCVNLANPGFGVQAMVDISATLKNLGVQPKAVIMQYSFCNRYFDVKTKKTIIPLTVKYISNKKLKKVYKVHTDYNDFEENVFYCKKILTALWKDTVTFSYTTSIQEDYNQEYLSFLDIPILSPIVDLKTPFIRARDYDHGGPASNMYNANIIFNNIKNKL